MPYINLLCTELKGKSELNAQIYFKKPKRLMIIEEIAPSTVFVE